MQKKPNKPRRVADKGKPQAERPAAKGRPKSARTVAKGKPLHPRSGDNTKQQAERTTAKGRPQPGRTPDKGKRQTARPFDKGRPRPRPATASDKATATGSESPEKRPAFTQKISARTFANFVKPLIAAPARPLDKVTLHSAPLAHLGYEEEVKIKNEALRRFWKEHHLPGSPEQVIGSPRPRSYRTTSKRKALLRGGTLYLLFGEKALETQKKPFLPSPLEPPEHEQIYRFLQQKLSEPTFKLVAAHLNYLIIRGSYTERAVIFNVDKLDGPLVRKLKMLAEHLQKLPAQVAAAFVYLDPTGSEYYLESTRPSSVVNFKKLYGPNLLMVKYQGRRYRFHPTSFSQVNESMVPVMLKKAKELLAPAKEEGLLDLYCGYGLFSLSLAPSYRKVIGIDFEGPSIKAAEDNSRLNEAGNVRFLARRITEELFDKVKLATASEAVLLDPPRQGPQPGVIEALIKRRPEKVLHIFCGVDQIPESVKEWKKSYLVRRIVPLDMFPGSANLEVLILLTPKG